MGTIIFIRSIRRKLQYFFSIASFDPCYHPPIRDYYTQYQNMGTGFL